jgi:hypothetical protein
VVDARQNDLDIGRCISVNVGLDDGVSTAFMPGNGVRDDVRVFAPEYESLIFLHRGIRINRRQINDITVQEVDYRIGLPGALSVKAVNRN